MRTGKGYTIFVFNLTSLTWRTPEEANRALSKHDPLVAVPRALHSDNHHTAFPIVNGGTNKPSVSTSSDDLLGALAVVTGSVTAKVSQIPNQPLWFASEARGRTEDAVLAYGMDTYLSTRDPQWLDQLPMTKAVVRAMDAVQPSRPNRGQSGPGPQGSTTSSSSGAPSEAG